VGAIGWEPALGSKNSVANAIDGNGKGRGFERAEEAAEIRIEAAKVERRIPNPPHTTNGDEERYADKCGTYTKALLQDAPGRVNLNSYQSFKTALHSGNPADFEDIIMGGGRKLVGPQGGLAFDMEGCDSQKFGNAPSPFCQETVVIVPPAPALASAAYGTELIELYWASLLRDVPFTQYPANPVAAQAAAEITQLPDYAGPRSGGQVTPELLFRGAFPGETIGPYISQFFITPTFFGQQPISQQQVSYQENVDYLTDPASWALIQNGGSTGLVNQDDPQACITILKFFFDGNFVIPNPLVPAEDGLSVVPYTGSDRNQLTVNGELNKLAHNVTFGHGIHAGIHWRSDSDVSMVLGEATAISFLQDQAETFNEKFTIHFTKLDGTTATISNQ
jgi:hypothetical protein